MSLNERLEFLINVNAEGAIKGFKAVGDEAERSLKKGQTGIEKTGTTMSKVGAGMVVGAGLIGFGLLELSKKWEESALAAGKLTTATGLTVEQASRWSVVAKGADVDTSTLATSLGKMDKAIQATPDKFNELGAAIVRTKSGAIDTNATFLNVVDALNASGGAANNAQTATALLGKGWQGMSEIIDQSSDDLKKRLDEVSKAQVFNEADVSEAEQLRDTMKELSNNAEGLALSLGKSAAPVIADVTTSLSGMVKGLSSVNDATGGVIGKFAAFGSLGVGAAGALTLVAGQAIKMRDKLTTVGEDGSRSLSGLGGVALGVGVAVAGFGIITAIMGQHAKEAKANVDDLSKRMEALGLTAEEAAQQKVAELVAKNEDLSTAMKQAGLTVADLQTAITGGSDATAAFNDKLNSTNGIITDAAGATGRYAAANDISTITMNALTDQVNGQATAYQTLVKQAETTTTATATLGETQAEVAAATKAGIDAQLAANKELVASEEGVVKAQEDQLKAQQDITNAARATVDAKWAYHEAEQATKEAIEAATATLKDQKSTQDDTADAINKGRDAAIDQADAFVRMKGDTDNAKAANDDMIQSLFSTASALDPASPIRQSILDYIADLQSIPTDIHTTISAGFVDTGAAGTHHDSFSPAAIVAKAAGSIAGARASGGPVQAGKAYMVGERGPEPFIPDTNGTILPNGAGTGPQVVNNFYGITDHDALLEKQSRAMGWAVLTGR